MIRLRGVSKWYPTPLGRKWVFRDLDLELPRGTHALLLGRNGAGKSTLLRLIAGLERPSSGAIEVAGTVSWSLALSGGWQGVMTGAENARFVARIHGCTRDQIRRVEAFVREVSGLDRDFDLPVSTYSSGMRARLGFALGMAFRFDWYIGDEFTAVGDPAFRARSEAAVAALKQRASWVVATHLTGGAIAKGVDRVLLLAQGRLHVFTDPRAGIAAYKALC
ncbi:MAG: hypothetical protein RLZZ127_876 [Planctomycetota bacterium]